MTLNFPKVPIDSSFFPTDDRSIDIALDRIRSMTSCFSCSCQVELEPWGSLADKISVHSAVQTVNHKKGEQQFIRLAPQMTPELNILLWL